MITLPHTQHGSGLQEDSRTGDSAGHDDRLVVAHSIEEWLPLTMEWVYNQVRYTPVSSAVVLARRLEDPALSPWDPVYVPTRRETQSARVSRRLGRRYAPASFSKQISHHGAVILHSHFGDRGWADIPLARRHGLKHVVTFYGYDIGLLPKRDPAWLTKYAELFRSADLFLCEGPHMKETLVALGCPREKVAVQRLGVDLGLLQCRPRKPDGPTVRILIAASFRQKKGIPLALEAVANVAESFPDIRVTVIGDAGGQPREQAEKAAILEVVRRRDLAEMVAFLGYQPHARLLEEAYKHHIFLSPSMTADDGDCEGGAPVTMIEMAATGMPIVSTRHCDIPQVVADGITGVLAEERDLTGLTRDLTELVTDGSRWASMGAAARSHIEERFDVFALTSRLAERYAELAARP